MATKYISSSLYSPTADQGISNDWQWNLNQNIVCVQSMKANLVEKM
jgi:hypothetical protein